jgi:hypothetical protein
MIISVSSEGSRSVHFQGFTQGNSKRFEQFFARALLAVDAGNFFNPADPPLASLLNNSRVAV